LECGENKKWGVHFSWHTCGTLLRPTQQQTYSKENLSALSRPTGKLLYGTCARTHSHRN
jgi:hypothetical protein